MVTEQQKYLSGILKATGFALLAPAGSIVFQWIVLKKSLFFGHSWYGVLAFSLGWLLMGWGYLMLEEKSNEN